eukprot:CAMPEP_0114587106 /NCGR_PEP_ID=MMETSP0125-20121206/10151_1 /TAXON_ID=485358 ORGANISM="Aristerostoma sp., Strain ATCC 50986" /NCGR_SAMPLE_ID=MMETSP0125 /ASSEMBLY_ACC=CAM_ASM_000245 /LENGTH=271 /DNA_ID=CAMNT_0001782855 /DNA_START=1054 /DNA_END=1866 /DNA_ORIENTATION=+
MGGDVGSEKIAQDMTKALLGYDPDIIIIGGDIAYDQAMLTCWYSWDEFFWMFENLGDKLNKVIPLVAGVGNHDVGYDAGSTLNINKEDPPHWFKFMPQHLKPAPNDTIGVDNIVAVPDFNERRTYFHHTFSGAVFLSLDSDYVYDYSGVQMQYLTNVSEENPDLLKIAYYHNPTYPCCQDFGDTSQTIQNHSMETWIPAFEDYSYLAVFENHVHLWKKTYSLKGGKVVDKDDGVTYFGDGNWGVNHAGCDTTAVSNSTGILETSGPTNHIW